MTFSYCYFNPFPYLCHALVHYVLSEQMMKRESGESPEQTRCCKSLPKRFRNTLYATVLHGGWEGSLKTGRVRRPAKAMIVFKLSGYKAVRHIKGNGSVMGWFLLSSHLFLLSESLFIKGKCI